MNHVGVRELRQSASKLLERVRAGEIIGITDRGRPVARLCPEPTSAWVALIEAGAVVPPRSDRDLAAIEPVSSGLAGSVVLEQLRRDER